MTAKWHVRTVYYLYVAFWPLQFAMESLRFSQSTPPLSAVTVEYKSAASHVPGSGA